MSMNINEYKWRSAELHDITHKVTDWPELILVSLTLPALPPLDGPVKIL